MGHPRQQRVVRRPRPGRLLATAAVVLASGLLASCEREDRTFHVNAPSADATTAVRTSDLQPGPAEPPPASLKGYDDNAYAIAQGQTLYTAMNCHGCHSPGGGGDIGPPLIDDLWRYGHRPEQIYATIKQGRPKGMPAFGSKIPDYQIWQLVAYVRSMSGLVPLDAAPGRLDHMQSSPAPNSIPTSRPVNAAPTP